MILLEGKYKHNTITGLEPLEEYPLKASSCVENSSNTTEFGDKKAVGRLRSNSATAQTFTLSNPPIPPYSTPARATDASRFSTLSSGKRLYQSTDPQLATEDNANMKSRVEKSKSVPPKPNTPSFKEFRPERKEKVDMDKLRASYEAAPTTEKVKPKKEEEKQVDKRSTSPSTVSTAVSNIQVITIMLHCLCTA